MGGPFVDRGGWIGGLVEQKVVAGETGVALATLRVQDPEGRPPPRRAVAVAGDQRLRPLADYVAPQVDPRPPGEFEADTGRLGDGGRETAGEARGFEHDEECLRTPGERRQPAEPVRDPGRTVRGREPAAGQVEDEHVHRSPGQQRATDGQALVERLGGDDDEPLQPNATRDRLDRVETARQVEPGHDRTGRLGLRREAVDEGRPATRAVAADRDAGRARQAAGAQDRVEGREARVDDTVVRGRDGMGLVPWPDIGEWRQVRGGRQGQGPVRDPRSCRSPASLEARHGSRHVRGEGSHRTLKIEHLFERIKGLSCRPGPEPPVERHRLVMRAAYRHSPTMLAMSDPANQIPERPILVVDDDAKIVRLVRTYLERDGFAVVTAADGPAALDAIERHRPALVVLDLMLPELDGRAVIRAVRRDDEAAATPILILSARGSTLDRIAGLEDGADDYLPKPFSPAELVLRVKSILRRTAAATPLGTPNTTLEQADLVIDLDRHEVTRDGRPIPLTRVEFRLLVTLVEAGGRVLSRDQLLDAVYGQDQSEVLDRTIDVHVGRLRDKLADDAEAPRYVATVRGVGYRAARS